jgi:hypothetical protein
MNRPPSAPPRLDGHRSVSAILAEMAESWPSDRITLGDFIEVLGNRGHGLVMLTLTLPNVVPVYIPGLSAVTGLPLAAVALQMALGRPRPWLPRFLLRRSIARSDFQRVVKRVLPWLARVERVLRPRLQQFAHGPAERLIGVACMLLALLLSLPVPLTNIPLAIPVALFALGVLERDGAATLIAAVAGTAATAFVLSVGWALFAGTLAFLRI